MAKKDNDEKEKPKKEINIEDFIIKTDDFIAEKKIIIPIGPALDQLTGGGIQEGSFLIFFGPDKCGKTITSLNFAANCQKPEYGGRDVYYLNIEGRIKKRDLLGIKGLNLNKFHLIGCKPPVKDKDGKILEPAVILTAEDYFTIADKLLKDHYGCVVIFDSESALCTETEHLGGMDEMQRADAAKMMYKFCRKICGVLSVNNNILITIRHVTSNVTGYGSPTTEKGGNAGKYQVDTKLRCLKSENWEVASSTKPIGKIVEWRLESGSLEGAIPGSKCTSYIRYGIGIDGLTEILGVAQDFGLITKPAKSAWLTCQYMQNYLDLLGVDKWDEQTEKMCKFQGANNLYLHMNDNPKWVECLEKEIKKVCG